MNRGAMVGLLAVLGLALVALSFLATSYDRSYLQSVEQALGAALLFGAAGLCIGKMGDPAAPKAPKAPKAAADPAADEKK
ncbi:MAG: hypothetical protein WCJ64_07555 [Rhodospirillaceae bacterium]